MLIPFHVLRTCWTNIGLILNMIALINVCFVNRIHRLCLFPVNLIVILNHWLNSFILYHIWLKETSNVVIASHFYKNFQDSIYIWPKSSFIFTWIHMLFTCPIFAHTYTFSVVWTASLSHEIIAIDFKIWSCEADTMSSLSISYLLFL